MLSNSWIFSKEKFRQSMGWNGEKLPEWTEKCEGLTESEMELKGCMTSIWWMKNIRNEKIERILKDE